MAKIFGFSTDRLKNSFDSMTDREKVMTIGFVALLALILVGGGLFWAISKSASRRAEIASMQSTIAEVQKLTPQFEVARKRNDGIVKAVESNRATLYSSVPDAARSLGLTVLALNGADDEVNRAAPKDAPFKTTGVKFSIGKLSIDKLTAFLREFEGENRDGVKKVMKLEIRPDPGSPDLLNVTMVAATWQKK